MHISKWVFIRYIPICSVCRTHNPVPSWHITGVVTRVTGRVPYAEQGRLTLPEHLNATPVFSWVRVARSLFFSVMFCRSLFVLFLLSFVFTSTDYRFGIFSIKLHNLNSILLINVCISILSLFLVFFGWILYLFQQCGIYCFSFYYKIGFPF